MPRSGEALERMRTESRERILDAALEVFAEHGFAGSSIRMLAERAGASQGLLYNYFDGKRDVLRAIMARGSAEVDRTFEEAEAASGWESLAALIRSALEAVRTSPTFWRLTYQLRMEPEVLAETGSEIAARAAAIRARIEDLLEGSEVAEPAVRASLIFGAVDGVAQHYVLDPERYPLEAVASDMIRCLVPEHRREEGATR